MLLTRHVGLRLFGIVDPSRTSGPEYWHDRRLGGTTTGTSGDDAGMSRQGLLPGTEGFGAIVAALGGRPGVVPPQPPSAPGRSFGSDALRVHGRIFAMMSAGRLVLKMPAARVAELIGAGEGHPFDAGKGRPMKEWVAIDPDRQDRWLVLATEALRFVGGGRPDGS